MKPELLFLPAPLPTVSQHPFQGKAGLPVLLWGSKPICQQLFHRGHFVTPSIWPMTNLQAIFKFVFCHLRLSSLQVLSLPAVYPGGSAQRSRSFVLSQAGEAVTAGNHRSCDGRNQGQADRQEDLGWCLFPKYIWARARRQL